MYVGGEKAAVAVLPVTGATAFMGTGGNVVVALAVAVAAGLLTWGVVYGRQAK